VPRATQSRFLVTAAIGFVAANVLHTLDHLRQGTAGLTTEIFVAGTSLSLGAVLVLVLILRGHPRGPAMAAFLGVSAAVGVAASHIAPHWSALSDPYPAISADALSWVVMLAEIAAALVLAAAGLAAGGRTPREALP
jgi:hypothetical protein